jgi:hypothetical protein
MHSPDLFEDTAIWERAGSTRICRGFEGKLWLLEVRGYGQRPIQLPSHGALVIGRSPKSHIQINHSSVSRRHVRIDIEDERLTLTDLESRNGTLLSDERVPANAPVPLQPGQHFELGPAQFVIVSRSILPAHGEALDVALREPPAPKEPGDRDTTRAPPPRASDEPASDRITIAPLSVPLSVDPATGRAWSDGEELEPLQRCPIQRKLLLCLLRHRNQYVPTTQIRKEIHEDRVTGSSNIPTQIWRLRATLREAGVVIRSQRSLGYGIFDAEPREG